MRDSRDVFHLAIPSYDLDDTVAFYVGLLGCKLARRYDDRVTLDFFGDQVVCHLSPRPEPFPRIEDVPMYPRHFGVTFREERDFDQFLELCRQRNVPFFKDVAERFVGKIEVHRTFTIYDPALNLLEFKYYADHRMMY
jgi:extradiol dioxygenase family protein